MKTGELPAPLYDGILTTDKNNHIFIGSAPFLAKYDPEGRLEWKKSGILSFGLDGRGNTYLFSRAGEYPQEEQIVKVTKYDTGGREVWSREERGVTLTSWTVDGSGNSFMLVAAVVNKQGAPSSIIEYGPDGKRRWGANVDGLTQSGVQYPISTDDHGDVYLYYNELKDDTTYEAFIAKFSDGRRVWTKNTRFNVRGLNPKPQLLIVRDRLYMFWEAEGACKIVAYELSSGRIVLSRRYRQPGNIRAITNDKRGNFYVIGGGSRGRSLSVTKISMNGKRLWVRNGLIDKNQPAYVPPSGGIAIGKNGDIFIAAHIWPRSGERFMAVGLSSTGRLKWRLPVGRTFSEPESEIGDSAMFITVDRAGDMIMAAGVSIESGIHKSFIAKYRP